MEKVNELIDSRTKKTTQKSGTGFKGVTRLNRPSASKPFRARFRIENNGESLTVSLGMYETAEAAQLARIKFIDSLK